MGVLGHNDIWVLACVARHREYYKGEGGDFSQVQAVVSVASLCLPVAHPCTKSDPTMHYDLVVWFVQICVNN